MFDLTALPIQKKAQYNYHARNRSSAGARNHDTRACELTITVLIYSYCTMDDDNASADSGSSTENDYSRTWRSVSMLLPRLSL